MNSPSAHLEIEIGRIRGLTQRRRHEDALTAAESLAVATPDGREVLYLIAINQRYLNRITAALATLGRLEQRHPGFSRLYQERGHCYTTLRDLPRAIEAFRRGVQINPTLSTSWLMLERLYRTTGDSANATAAAEQAAKLAALPNEVVRAESLLSDGDLTGAGKLVRSHLQRDTNNIAARRLLVRVLIDQLDYSQARAELDRLLQLEPANAAFRYWSAIVCAGLGEHDRAIGLYDELLAGTPQPAAEINLLRGHSLKAVGRQRQAVESYQAAAAVRAEFADAYWSLANLKTYRFSPDEIARMRTGEAAPGVPPVDRYHLCFALGKALEDLGEFAQSWQYYERGNALKRAESGYRVEFTEADTRRLIDMYTVEFLAAHMGAGAPDPDPIFIVGLPRSGSTLVEQILASHSLVEGTRELAEIPRIAQALDGRPPGFEEARTLGERYVADTRVYRIAGKSFFTDKMPNNFRHIGLIHLLLPNARIIDVRRDPMACCCSNFKQLFAGGQEFTYSSDDIARYYRTYLDLMQHWDQVLPGRVLRVQYENVVEDLEGNVRRILDFCGLEFESGPVEFHRTQRSVGTASSEQVRQPIYRDGLSQWRNFEPWLGPLQAALRHSAVIPPT